MDAANWQAWVVVVVIGTMVAALVREWARQDIIFLGALGMLLLVGVVTPEQAFSGFSNSAVLTVGALFVVAAGVQRTNALGFLDRIIFSTSRRPGRVVPQIMLPVALLSAVLNNTPVVAMLAPRLQQWAAERGVAASKLLIPLSYASIVGGLITLIGTSTNLVVSGLMEASGYAGLGMFDLTWVGLPASLAVVAFFALGGHRLLPDRHRAAPDEADGLKDCLFELRVATGGPLVGRTIEEAELRSLGDAYLVHVRRAGRLVPAAPQELLQEGDVLAFAGSLRMLESLLQRPGLERVVSAPVGDGYQTMPLYEAVVAPSSNLVGRTLREAEFREHYQGVVLAIQRKDERVDGPLGRIPIRAGDLLLVEARNGFDRQWNANRDEFYLVAPRRSDRAAHRSGRAPLALVVVVVMVAAAASGLVPIVTAAFAAALAMILTHCLSTTEARRAVDIPVLVIIAAALGLGRAVEQTGLANLAADALVAQTAGLGVVMTLVVLYVTTNVMTELITHKAAAVLMLPVALAAAAELGIPPKAAAIVITVAAAASFMTPIGYQTNLMVMSAGGYRYRDYFRVGLPVSLLVMSVALTMVWLVWIR